MGDTRARTPAQHTGDTATPMRRTRTARHRDPNVPGPGESICPVCDRPGFAMLDARGIKIVHRYGGWPHRAAPGLSFRMLHTVPDPGALAAWLASPAETACPRCTHRRDAHTMHSDHGDRDVCPCGCPGPGGTINP